VYKSIVNVVLKIRFILGRNSKFTVIVDNSICRYCSISKGDVSVDRVTLYTISHLIETDIFVHY